MVRADRSPNLPKSLKLSALCCMVIMQNFEAGKPELTMNEVTDRILNYLDIELSDQDKENFVRSVTYSIKSLNELKIICRLETALTNLRTKKFVIKPL